MRWSDPPRLWAYLVAFAALGCCAGLAYWPIVRDICEFWTGEGDGAKTWQWLERCDDADNFVLEGAQLLLSNPLLAWLPDTAIIYVFEPVAWFAKATLAGVIQLFGVPIALAPAPLIFRGATLFFHWLNSCLLLEATRHLLHLASPSFPTSSDGAAAIELLGCCLPAALAFAVHPVNVEVMGWASCFPYGLALLFALWSLLEYMRNVERNGNGDGCGGLRGAVLPPVLYAAAVLSKSAALLWPATFVLIDIAKAAASAGAAGSDAGATAPDHSNDRENGSSSGGSGGGGGSGVAAMSEGPQCQRQQIQQRQRRRRRPGRPGRAAWALLRYAGGKAPYAAVAAAVAVVTLRVNDGGSSQTTDVIHLSPRERLAKAHLTVWMYARLLLWPEKLRSHYRLRASDMALGGGAAVAGNVAAEVGGGGGGGGCSGGGEGAGGDDVPEVAFAAAMIWALNMATALHLGSLAWKAFCNADDAEELDAAMESNFGGWNSAALRLKSCLVGAATDTAKTGRNGSGDGGSSNNGNTRGKGKGGGGSGGGKHKRGANDAGSGGSHATKEKRVTFAPSDDAFGELSGKPGSSGTISANGSSAVTALADRGNGSNGGGVGSGMGGGICFPLLAWAHYVAVFLPFCGLVQHGVISKGGDRYGYLTYPAFVPLLAGALRAWAFGGSGGGGGNNDDGDGDDIGGGGSGSSIGSGSSGGRGDGNGCDGQTSVSAFIESGGSGVCGGGKPARRTYRGAAVRAVAAALALLPPLAVLAVMSAQQIKHWRTDETVLTRALAVDSGDWRMMDILLNHYSNGGRDAEAAALLERLRQPNVFADVPGDSPKKPLFRAKYDVVAGDLSAACAVYRAALPRWPDEPFLLHNVGLCMLYDPAGSATAAAVAAAAAAINNADTADSDFGTAGNGGGGGGGSDSGSLPSSASASLTPDDFRRLAADGVAHMVHAAELLGARPARNARAGHDRLHDMQGAHVREAAAEHRQWRDAGFAGPLPGRISVIF